jgi:hypothetical protein
MQLAAGMRVRTTESAHHGGWTEVVVLGGLAAELALLIGDRGSIAAMLLACLATGFWWYGFGRAGDICDPVALGNAAGIMIGLGIGYPQLLLPLAVAIPVIVATTLQRAVAGGHARVVPVFLLTGMIAGLGAGWLALNVHILPV